MSKKCPHGGLVLYLDCIECDDKLCKHPKGKEAKENYIESFKTLHDPASIDKHHDYISSVIDSNMKNKIYRLYYQYIYNRTDFMDYPAIKIGQTDYNHVISYEIDLCPPNSPSVYTYTIFYESRSQAILVHRRRYVENQGIVKAIYYKSPNSPVSYDVFCNRSYDEKLDIDELVKLANFDWCSIPKIYNNELNRKMVQLFKIKFLKCLLKDGVIIWCANEYEYIRNYGDNVCCEYCRNKSKCEKQKVMIYK